MVGYCKGETRHEDVDVVDADADDERRPRPRPRAVDADRADAERVVDVKVVAQRPKERRRARDVPDVLEVLARVVAEALRLRPIQPQRFSAVVHGADVAEARVLGHAVGLREAPERPAADAGADFADRLLRVPEQVLEADL